MGKHTAVEMDDSEVAQLLHAQDTGVLSLAKDGDAYGIPVSFNYRQKNRRVYFRLGFAPGSQKREFLDATDHASFEVHDRTDAGWKSVVASGSLVEATSDEIGTQVVQSVEQLQIPYFQVFDRPKEELDLRIVYLDVERVRGLVEG
jgi:nitroimidazol reductase NimA-like FMN-containing flavoprotein (pyridoxamine 5'-phosphate oxidase superfamily)